MIYKNTFCKLLVIKIHYKYYFTVKICTSRLIAYLNNNNVKLAIQYRHHYDIYPIYFLSQTLITTITIHFGKFAINNTIKTKATSTRWLLLISLGTTPTVVKGCVKIVSST